ncbi:protein MICROTUBULE BINDING PROTEIN 2C-like [Phoenix dactylifera]|uniref:Protein MICROTUBULE BINDING PROTEIN 2C-like n=1 Tax=Phoenix dactylifera TaxID=42345 RepID=A0A8B7CEV2_PHODC|nr:protein MICROTUBULE BINDING PROTEIN 2C-like [Phoenix dactylifera]
MLGKPQKRRGLDEPQERGTFAGCTSSPPPPPLSSSSKNAPGDGGNVDRVLFNNLVEMVPLVESLMDRRGNPSFTRRASVVYTPTPSNQTKVVDLKGRKPSKTVSAKKHRDLRDLSKDTNDQDVTTDNLSVFSSTPLAVGYVQKNIEELTVVQEQLDDLRKKILEKDEALKSAEETMNRMSRVNMMLDELRHQVAEKDSVVRNANSQLANTQIKLADKQAALEKLEWEARTSNTKIEELQGDLDSMGFEITALMRLFEELSKNDSAAYPDDDITSIQKFDQLPYIDSIDESDMARMEEARKAYTAAIAAAKENPSEELLAAAAEARLHLRAFVL